MVVAWLSDINELVGLEINNVVHDVGWGIDSSSYAVGSKS